MSKVDAQRAFREANFARRKPGDKPVESAAVATSPKRTAPATAATEPVSSTKSPVPTEGALCGHRNMGNKTCKRPAGHPEKNHRYK